MYRGRTMLTSKQVGLGPRVFFGLALPFLVVWTGSAYSKSFDRQGDGATAPIAAPNLEDHASYFAEKRVGVSAAALKKADHLRRKTIGSIQSLLKDSRKSARRFELHLRLGELYVERHDYLRDVEMRTYDEQYEAWEKLDQDKRGDEPQLSTRGSTAELTRAANSFRRLVREFPRHPRTDSALYALAKTLARLGKSTSVNYYEQLVKSHPKSKLLPETYLALGENYFEKHQIEAAIKYYKLAMQFKDQPAYPYAVYKLGWAYYNAPVKNDADAKTNYGKAITAFKLVVKLAELDKTRSARNLDLKDEAIRDLIMVWAEGEDVASAWRYFKTIGQHQSFYTMLERLGHIYATQGKNTKAIAVFQRLLRDAPGRPHNPEIHAKLVELLDLTNKPTKVVAELQRMQKSYLGRSPWKGALSKKEELSQDAIKKRTEAIEKAPKLVENMLHRYGALYHQRGQKSKDSRYLSYAATLYASYLETFVKEPAAYDIRYYLAEILFDFKKYEIASDHYLKVAKASKNGKYRKPAALNSVAALNQLVVNTKFPKLPPAGQATKSLPIPSQKQRLVKGIDNYIALLPKEADGYPMRFTAAQIYFEHGHYDQALKRFNNLTKELPETPQAKAAVRVVLAFHTDREDWAKLIVWSKDFGGRQKLMDAETKKYVVDLLRGSMFKQALALEKRQSYQKAAMAFLDYQKEFPTDKNADRALFNANINFAKIGRIKDALAASNLLLKNYADSKLKADVLASQATTYEALANFSEAASFYQTLATQFANDQRAPGALYNSAVLYKGIGDKEKATKAFDRFVKFYPKHKAAVDARTELAKLYEDDKKWTAAIAVYETLAADKMANADQQALAMAKAASLETLHVSRSKGRKAAERVRARLVKKDAPTAFEARRTVASTLFELVEPAFGAFQATAISDGGQIERQVQTKQQRLEKLAAAYEKVIELGSAEYSVASLYRLGQAHENFATALFQAPAPSGASQVDIDKLRTELEKVAFPLKDEAYKFFETAYKRSTEVQTFTVWTQRTYQKMVELAPDRHPPIDELSASPAYLSHDLSVKQPAVAKLLK